MTLVTVLEADWSRTYSVDDLDQFLLEAPEPPPTPRRPDIPYIGPERAGDAFNASVDAGELLVASGWTLHHADRNGDRHYTRPGKERRDGSSATVYADGHTCVWTDATSLEPRRWYDPFGLYAAIHHGGDHAAAASALGEQGYGKRHVELTFIRPPEESAAPRGDEPWPEPVPLRNATDLPVFPVHALPAWIAEHAAAVAAELQSPVDLPAMLGIAALSVAAAKRARVVVRGTWTEPANLYLVVAMPPSSGKSPAYNAMIRPLREFEQEQLERTAPLIAKRTQERRVLESKMKKAEAKDDLDEAGRFLMDLLGAEPIHPPRLMTDDATPEAVVRMLGEQKGRLAIMSPEGGLFDMMAGRYSDQSNLDPYLKAWSGDTIIVDRMTRETVSVDNPSLVIGLTVQPSVIAALADRPEMAGRGLTARFMYAIPPDVVGQRNMIDPPLADPGLAIEYRRRLLSITSVDYTHPVSIELDEPARRRFLTWRQSLEDQRGPFGDMRPMAEWSTKLESSVARLSLLLHIAEHGYEGRVSDETMARAIEIGNYWIEHGKAAHDLWVVDPVRSAALAILDWIKQKGAADFTVRDAWRGLRRRFPQPSDLLEPLMLLIETGWLRPMFDGPFEIGRGKASPQFASHPKASIQKRDVATVAPVAPVNRLTSDALNENDRDASSFDIVATVAPVALKSEKGSSSSSSLEEEGWGGTAGPVATGATVPTTPPEGEDIYARIRRTDPKLAALL